MSVQAVQNEIRIARADGNISVLDMSAIITAAKRNVTDDEIAELNGLLGAVHSGEVTLETGVDAVLADYIQPGKHATTVSETMGEWFMAPAKFMTDPALEWMNKQEGAMRILAVILAILAIILGAVFVIASAIVTVPGGAIAGAIEAGKD